MIYSVWQADQKAYDYYEDNTPVGVKRDKEALGLLTTTGSGRSLAPQQVMTPVPLLAKKVGNGVAAKGQMASGKQILGMSPSTAMFVGVGAWLVYKWWGNRG